MSAEDLNLAEEIFKVDVATCKGKSTRPHPPVVDKNDIVELPPELRVQGMKLELVMDEASYIPLIGVLDIIVLLY